VTSSSGCRAKPSSNGCYRVSLPVFVVVLAVLAFELGDAAGAGGVGAPASPVVAWTSWEFRAPGGGVGSVSGEHVKERKGIRAAVAAVKTMPRSEIGLPGSCELRVERRMTPDVDGDGRGDALFRLEWVVAGDGTLPRCRGGFRGEGYRVVVFVLARSGGAPASLLWQASEADVSAAISLGKLANGRPVIVVKEEMSESDTDCSVETTRVLDPATSEGLQELSRTSSGVDVRRRRVVPIGFPVHHDAASLRGWENARELRVGPRDGAGKLHCRPAELRPRKMKPR